MARFDHGAGQWHDSLTRNVGHDISCPYENTGLPNTRLPQYRVTQYRVTQYRVTQYRITQYRITDYPIPPTLVIRHSALVIRLLVA